MAARLHDPSYVERVCASGQSRLKNLKGMANLQWELAGGRTCTQCPNYQRIQSNCAEDTGKLDCNYCHIRAVKG